MLIAALFFLSSVRAADTATAAIEQAQTLALKKNRVEACTVLKRAISIQPAGATRTRMRDTLNELSRVFFTDKGQRAFEAGQSVLFENPDVALAQLREALRLEDGNVVVRTTLAKAYLQRNDCAAAQTELNAARELNPGDGDAAALDLRALVCQKNWELMRLRAKALPPLDAWQTSFVLYVQAQDWLQLGLATKANEALTKITTEFPKFPEPRYYLARAEGARGDSNLRKYVSLCRALTARDRRAFALEPRTCTKQKEAEDELAKKSIDL